MKRYLFPSCVLSGCIGGGLGAVLGGGWVLAGFSAGVILALIASFASDQSHKAEQKSLKTSQFKYGKKYESSLNRRAAW